LLYCWVSESKHLGDVQSALPAQVCIQAGVPVDEAVGDGDWALIIKVNKIKRTIITKYLLILVY
jgi:hypothetical protein